jgi:hypothetical protein
VLLHQEQNHAVRTRVIGITSLAATTTTASVGGIRGIGRRGVRRGLTRRGVGFVRLWPVVWQLIERAAESTRSVRILRAQGVAGCT